MESAASGAFFMRYLRPLVLLSIGIALFAAACGGGGGSSLPAGVVAQVKGQSITKAELDALLDQTRHSYKAQKRVFPKAGSAEYQSLVQQAVQYLVQNAEYEQKAAALGVKVTAADIDKRLKQIKKQYFGGSEKRYRAALKKQGLTDKQVQESIRVQLVQEALSKRLTKSITVTDDEARAYYLQHPQTYTMPESRNVRHILVKKKALADSIYKQLCGSASPCTKAKADFAALAKKYSTDPGSKNQGGKYTAVRGQSVPEFDKVAFELKTGEISKPVHTQYGWHVIQAISNVHPRKTTPFNQVKAAIKSQLLSQKQSAAVAKFRTDLAKEYAGKVKYAKGYEPPASTSTTSTQATTTASTTG